MVAVAVCEVVPRVPLGLGMLVAACGGRLVVAVLVTVLVTVLDHLSRWLGELVRRFTFFGASGAEPHDGEMREPRVVAERSPDLSANAVELLGRDRSDRTTLLAVQVFLLPVADQHV